MQAQQAEHNINDNACHNTDGHRCITQDKHYWRRQNSMLLPISISMKKSIENKRRSNQRSFAFLFADDNYAHGCAPS
jgi:hypothetical protein